MTKYKLYKTLKSGLRKFRTITQKFLPQKKKTYTDEEGRKQLGRKDEATGRHIKGVT